VKNEDGRIGDDAAVSARLIQAQAVAGAATAYADRQGALPGYHLCCAAGRAIDRRPVALMGLAAAGFFLSNHGDRIRFGGHRRAKVPVHVNNKNWGGT
jgi:hypothetical protein